LPTPDSTDPDPGLSSPVGQVLAGRYRIERVIGRGGMGEVLLAHDTLLHRKVALKHLRADGAQGADRRTAMLKEARRASQVGDRRIAAIHDVLDLGDDVLLVMEYVEGSTLREHLKQPFPLERFWELSSECLEALACAHAHGVIHRDIKPENLMLTSEGEVKILDFGLALRSERHDLPVVSEGPTASVQAHHFPAGTPLYMAPEAHYGGHIDERTDLFSLGAVFYEMLTARHPFAGAAYESVIDAIMNRVPPPVTRWNPAVPDQLSSVVARMLERDPGKRFASCEDVAAALASARTATEYAPAVERAPTRTITRVRTPGNVLSLAAVAVAVAALVVWGVLRTPVLPRDRLVAILPPLATNTPTDFEAFALGSLDLLSMRLRPFQAESGFQMTPFAESYLAQPKAAQEARSLHGANLVLVPSVERRGNLLHGSLELREAAKERRLGAREFAVPAADPASFQDSLFGASVALLRLPRTRAATPGIGVRGAGTLRFLAQGIGRLCAEKSKEVRDNARADLEAACRAEPDAAVARVWLATAELRMTRDRPGLAWLQHVEATARAAVALDSTRADGHHVLGTVLVSQKRDREALPEFRRATERDPTRDESWRSYGLCHRRVGHPEGERAVYEAAIARRPHAYQPRLLLATWEFEHGHIEAAIQRYREMISRAPSLARGYATLGGVLMLQGEYARAIDTLKIAVSLRPGATAFTNLGSAYFNTGQAAAAVEAYNQALQFGEPNYALWQNLGDAYYWLHGNSAQARGAYEQAILLGRERMRAIAWRHTAPDVMIAANLACVYSKIDQPDSARALLADALAADSANVMVQYCAALTHWDLAERAQALDWLERAVAGGYPLQGIRDSPVHRDWAREPRFRALLAASATTSLTHPPR
jgi:eukaryotic-like serine/threonine-protein kinase